MFHGTPRSIYIGCISKAPPMLPNTTTPTSSSFSDSDSIPIREEEIFLAFGFDPVAREFASGLGAAVFERAHGNPGPA